MKLFIATRWGNPYEADGPDGKDTNFLVRASDFDQAARLAEDVLQHYPLRIGDNRAVQGIIHCIQQIGEDPTSETPSVIHGPWIEFICIRDSSYDIWHRDEPNGRWFNTSEEMKSREETEQGHGANALPRAAHD